MNKVEKSSVVLLAQKCYKLEQFKAIAAGDGVLTGWVASNVISTVKERKNGLFFARIGKVEYKTCLELHSHGTFFINSFFFFFLYSGGACSLFM